MAFGNIEIGTQWKLSNLNSLESFKIYFKAAILTLILKFTICLLKYLTVKF